VHTPGPWIVSPYAKNLVVTADDKVGIADVAMCAPWIKKPPQEEQDANAKLMAAAPDLLNELKILYETHPSESVHKAIEKAGG
jgi:hypothetical protein